MIAALATLVLLQQGAALPASAPPNVVIILADDLGWGDLPSYGNKLVKTPHIDRLVQEGIRFTNFYAAAPVCSPSRAGLLTGRDPARFGLKEVLRPNSRFSLGEGEQTLATLLQGRGYATACIGKWHLGSIPSSFPPSYGFDRFFGMPYSNDMLPLVFIDQDRTVESYATREQAKAVMPTLTRRFTEEALEFIRKNKARPFFLYLAHAMPHNPVAASPAFSGRSAMGPVGDAIEELDWSVGEVTNLLGALSLDRKTLVVFLSDNGMTHDGPVKGRPRRKGEKGSPVVNGGLRGGKFNFFEGGLRVPCVVRWTGTIAAGRTENAAAGLMDWFPTIRRIVGAVDRGQALDGKDLSGVLLGGAARADQEFCWPDEAYRSGRWKLVLSPPVANARTSMLFDLDADPGEAVDVAAAHPDVVARLEAALKAASASRRLRR